MVPVPLSYPRGSWTTSCRTRTASSSSPHCTAAEGSSVSPGTFVRGAQDNHLSLGPAFRSSVPLGCLLLCCTPELPLGREKRPGAKNEPFWARHVSREGEQTPEPSIPSRRGGGGCSCNMSGVEGALCPGDPAACHSYVLVYLSTE